MGSHFNLLPEGCVSTILSLTSPEDVCKSSSVSSTFQSAAESDLVWDKLLPYDHLDLVSRTITPLQFSSKKQLFNRLCNPVLLDGGLKSFKLEKLTGKKSFVLSARSLSIRRSNEPTHWQWKSLPESSFSNVAVLITMSLLEIQGKISTQSLSPNTRYGAFLVLKISPCSFGLDSIACEISIESGNRVSSTSTAYLRSCGEKDGKKQEMERLFYGNRIQMLKSRVVEGDGRVPREREDGWLEIELGQFFSGESDEEVKMKLMEVKGHHLKGGLTIEGIEVRPVMWWKCT